MLIIAVEYNGNLTVTHKFHRNIAMVVSYGYMDISQIDVSIFMVFRILSRSYLLCSLGKVVISFYEGCRQLELAKVYIKCQFDLNILAFPYHG